MKQTAVEWLEKEFVKLEHRIYVHSKMYELLDQAKEIEKQQKGYSEEEVRNILFQLERFINKGKETYTEIPEWWFEQFKNK